MSVSPNLRLTCDGNKPLNNLSVGCFSEYVEDFSNVYIMRNVTKVDNYTNAGGVVDPYPIAETVGAVDCSEYNQGGCPDNPCYVCGDFGATNYHLPCWPFSPTHYKTCEAKNINYPIGDYHNCFAPTETTYSITKCHQIVGWKAVGASKAWPGRLPYTSRKWGFPDDFGDWCCVGAGCSWHNYDPTADQTKYLAMSSISSTTLVTTLYDCTTTVLCSCNPDPALCNCTCCTDAGGNPYCLDQSCTSCTSTGTTTGTAEAHSAVHMDKFGNLFIDVCSSGSSGYDSFNLGPAAAHAWSLCGGVPNGNVIDNYNRYCSGIQTFGLFTTPAVITRRSANSWRLEWTTDINCFDACGILSSTTAVTTAVLDITPTTFDLYTYANKPAKSCCSTDGQCSGGSCGGLDIIQTSHQHYEFSGTTSNYTGDFTGLGSVSFDQTFHEEVNGSLSSPYTAKQVEDDLNKNLLATWDIGLDWQYPWRYADSNMSLIPYVCYDESSGVPTVGTCDTGSRFTGQIKGKPLFEKVGDRTYIPDKVFDPYHLNQCICDSLVSPGCLQPYTHTHGAYSTDIGVPCATQWFNYFDAGQLPQGGFKGSNFRFSVVPPCHGDPVQSFDDTMWAVKYAEIVIPKQSYNYFRPCGEDRFMPTGSNAAHCINLIDGHTLDLDPTSGTVTDIVSGDYVWVCGTAEYDGCWKANSDGAYTITLIEPRIVSASVLPRAPILNCGTSNGICSKLRWQILQPAICGRIDITNAVHGNTGSIVTCSLAEPTYLVNNDQVRISNAKGFKEINGVWTVKIIDQSNVGLVGSEALPTSHGYLGSGQMYSSFGPDWKWNDDSSKGQYSVVDYRYNLRDVGEYLRLATDWTSSQFGTLCDSVTPCSPGTVPPDFRIAQAGCGLNQYVIGPTCSIQCLTPMDCAPAVAYFSPNTESFLNGNNYGFPFIGGDSQYGVRWNGMVKQEMIDPLFQVPPCPCAPETTPGVDGDGLPIDIPDGNINCSQFVWQMDTGQCLSDFTDGNGAKHKLYPHSNIYESMCAIPDGAPPLPPHVFIGCLKTTDFKKPGTCPEGNICSPPFADANAAFDLGETCTPYKTFPWATPWLTYLYRYNCVCNEGRFAQPYEDNGISCENIILPPPF